MMRVVAVVLGLLLVAGGVLWTLAGLGYLSGSDMSGSPTWAVVGPLVAGFGVALLLVAVRGPR